MRKSVAIDKLLLLCEYDVASTARMSWDCRRCGRLCRPLEPACPACTWSRPPGPCRDKKLIFKYPLPKADAHKARET